jgi:L-threonylcarbamoyladenylate synthase
MIRLTIDPDSPDPAAIGRAADVIRSGGLVAIPTDTLYGLAADPFDVQAVARVFQAKGRPNELALPLIAADLEQVQQRIGALPPSAIRLAGQFWPGPLTLVVSAPQTLAAGVAAANHTVGVRVPANAVARQLCRAADRPLTATSANISGQPATDDPGVVEAALGATVDMLIDAGRTAGGPPSTLVDVTTAVPRLVRAGAVSWEDVKRCLQRV